MTDVEFWAKEVVKLPQLLGPIISDFREFRLEKGTAFGWTVYRDDEIQCVKSIMLSGTEFPVHDHIHSVETLILYQGSGRVICEGPGKECETIEFIKRVPVYLEQGRKHSLKIDRTASILAIFIPPESSFD